MIFDKSENRPERTIDGIIYVNIAKSNEIAEKKRLQIDVLR